MNFHFCFLVRTSIIKWVGRGLQKLAKRESMKFLVKWGLIKKVDALLDPQPQSEGSYKIGSVHPSICPSVCL